MNWYAKAIEKLSEENLDYKQICMEIAQRHPKIFVEASMGKLVERLKDLKRQGLVIQAIKEYRNETGNSLIKAKDFVDNLKR